MNEPCNQHEDAESVDVLVVGGGIAGLTAAAYAARAGARTTLVEAHGLGGRARTVERSGVLMNEGAHALYDAGEGRAVLSALGVSVVGHPPLAPVRLRLGEATHVAPFAVAHLAGTSLLSAREKVSFAAAYAKVMRTSLDGLEGITFEAWLRDSIDAPKVRSVIECISRVATYTNGASTLSAAAALAQLRLAGKGVSYLDGGWQSLIDALAGAARRAGAAVRDHVPVEGMVRDDDGWMVRLGSGGAAGRVRAASVVVAGGGPAVAARLLGVDSAVFASAGAPVHASVLDLVLDTLPEHPVLFGVHRPLYLSAHCPPAKLGDAVLVTAMAYHALDEDRSPDDMRAELRAHFDAANVGRSPARVLDERYLHRLVVAHGRPSATHGGLAGRPGVASPGVAGAFVAGDWVGPDGLLADASLASGRAAGVAAASAAAAAVAVVGGRMAASR